MISPTVIAQLAPVKRSAVVDWIDVLESTFLVARSTWRTTGGVEVDFIVETDGGLLAVEVKSAHTLRPADRRGLLAFHDEFCDARLVVLADVAVKQQQQGPITIFLLAEFLLGIVPGTPLPA